MPATDDASSPAAPTVSVVLPTRARMDLLDRSLDALIGQSHDPRQVEIIVVDDEPDHHTLHLVAGWRKRTPGRGPRLVYLANTGPHGPGAARNRGWHAARADIVAFIVEDAVPQHDWLVNGLADFADGADVVCGRIQRPVAPVAPVPTDRQTSAQAHERADFTSANCFMRKAVLEQLDGFDERFHRQRGSDADLHFRLIEHGVRIVHAPQALTVQPIPPTPWCASLLQIRHAVFDALLYKKHPLLYRQRVQARPCWDDYAIVTALLMALAGWWLGLDPLALAATVLWLALSLRLCAQRLKGATHSTSHIAEIALTSLLLPPLAVFWRLAGALRYRVRFA